MKYTTNDVRLYGRGPAVKKRRREAAMEMAEHCRPFLNSNYFGICSDCGREEKLQASASNLACADPICHCCYRLRNYYNDKYDREFFGKKLTRDEAHDIYEARVAYNKITERDWRYRAGAA